MPAERPRMMPESRSCIGEPTKCGARACKAMPNMSMMTPCKMPFCLSSSWVRRSSSISCRSCKAVFLPSMSSLTLMSRLSGQPVLGGVQAAAQPSVQSSVQSSAQPFVQSSAVSSAVSSTVSSASSSREQAQDAPRTYSAPTPQAPDNSAVSREESRPAITEQSAAPDDAGNLTPPKPRRVRTGKSPALSLNSIIGQEVLCLIEEQLSPFSPIAERTTKSER